MPLNDLVNAGSTGNFNFSAQTNRYIFGGTAELRLPFGLGVEVDALYRHLSYTGSGSIVGITTTTQSISTTVQRLGVPDPGQVPLFQGRPAAPLRRRRPGLEYACKA